MESLSAYAKMVELFLTVWDTVHHATIEANVCFITIHPNVFVHTKSMM